MHNYYTYLYNETVFELLREYRGETEAVLFARSATVGGQRFPVHWGGDSLATFESMAESLRGGLSLLASGFGFWSHDIGGFEGQPEPALFKRWIPFGLLSSHSRLHGNESYRVPWLFDDEAVDVLRHFTRQKNGLMPYLYQAAIGAHEQGVPVMRPMVLEFPDDPAVTHLEQQYMLGDSLLVAPVFSAGGETSFYVPAGRWTRYTTGETVRGPAWLRERHGFDSVPLLVRPGSVIPVGAREDRPDYAYHEGVTLRVYQPEDGARVTVPVPSTEGTTAATFEVVRDGDTVRVTRDGPPAPWRVSVLSGTSASTVDVPAATGECEVHIGG
jgi:alpha-D-xyloside xylohydrolase